MDLLLKMVVFHCYVSFPEGMCDRLFGDGFGSTSSFQSLGFVFLTRLKHQNKTHEISTNRINRHFPPPSEISSFIVKLVVVVVVAGVVVVTSAKPGKFEQRSPYY